METPKVPSDKSSKEYRTLISSPCEENDDTYAISQAVRLKV